KILRAADTLCARRREGPYRFIQNRSRTFLVALKSDATAEKAKNQFWRDFPRRSIFDFCNKSCLMCQTWPFRPDIAEKRARLPYRGLHSGLQRARLFPWGIWARTGPLARPARRAPSARPPYSPPRRPPA